MFTGLITEKALALSFAEYGEGWRLILSAPISAPDAEIGDSFAINGCCLTVVTREEATLVFDVLAETKRLTNLDVLVAGDAVNLEPSLRFGGKMGGHFVSGHIDGMGEILTFEPRGADHYLQVRAPTGMGRYLISKGSIAIDGISLTVAEVSGDVFAVWLIPHTVKVTNLATRRPGKRVNLEFDLLGKYVEKLMAGSAVASPGEMGSA